MYRFGAKVRKALWAWPFINAVVVRWAPSSSLPPRETSFCFGKEEKTKKTYNPSPHIATPIHHDRAFPPRPTPIPSQPNPFNTRRTNYAETEPISWTHTRACVAQVVRLIATRMGVGEDGMMEDRLSWLHSGGFGVGQKCGNAAGYESMTHTTD